jgi:DNA topoisomerase III
MKLMIAEKRSQVDQIKDAMGWKRIAHGVVEGELDGDKLILTCARGHILGLAPPDKVIEGLTWNEVERLTPIPDSFTKVILKDPPGSKGMSPKEYFDRIKKYSKDADEIIIAADPDREGDLIGWEIVEKLKFKGGLRRLWLVHGMDEKGIKRSFNEILDSENSEKLFRAAEGRERGDWAFQFMTRAYTYYGRKGLLGPNIASGKKKASVASLGRVQLPALNLVKMRCDEIENFVSRTHYIVKPKFDLSGVVINSVYDPVVTKESMELELPHVYWEPTKSVEGNQLDKPYFIGKDRVKAFENDIIANKNNATVVDFKIRQKEKHPPMPFDLNAANSEAAKRFGVTVSVAQKAIEDLYQKGYTSYPRTEDREVPEALYDKNERDVVLGHLSTIKELSSQVETVRQIHDGNNEKVKPFKPKCFSKKPMSHYGIIPTGTKADLTSLTDVERKIYLMIATRYVLNFFPPAQVSETTAKFSIPVKGLLDEEESFLATKEEVITDPGFLSAFKEKDTGSSSLPNMKKGDPVTVDSVESEEKKTTAPPYYDDSSIGTAMKHAGRYVQDPSLRRFLKKVEGIGRPATRTAIIETLLDRQYIVRKKGKLHITEAGKDLINLVPEWMASPEMTAVWEGYLENISEAPTPEKAKEMRDKFINKQYNDLSTHIEELIEKYKGKKGMARENSKPSEKQLEFAKSIAYIRGVELPQEAMDSGAECSSFIEENKTESMPSLKMFKLAEKLASEGEVELPPETRESYQACKDFIDERISKNPRKPSEKMVSFAKSLVEKNNVEGLPEGWEDSYDEVKKILDTYANK